jgi:hypothetical protein
MDTLLFYAVKRLTMEVRMNAMDSLAAVLRNTEAQKGLVFLYALSQQECTRNGQCGMEIGMSREKDQGAVLKEFMGNDIELDLNNDLPEDYVVKGEKVSAKHSQGKVGSPVKAKWTSADKSVEDAIHGMVDAPDSYYPHLLLTYIDIKHKKISIRGIPSEDNRTVIKTLGTEAFKVPKGNSRGIEYSPAAMKLLMERAYFSIEIEDADLTMGTNPIERRRQLLRDMGFTQTPPA